MRNLNYEHCRTIQKEFCISTGNSICLSSERLLALRYIVNLTDTINDNQTQIINLQRDLTKLLKKNYRSKHKTNFCRVYVADGREFIQTIS